MNKVTFDFSAIKGVYILLIIAGHNIVINKISPDAFGFLYSFHVFGFFLLPFLIQSRVVNSVNIATYAIRYLTPYIVMYLILYFIYQVIYNDPVDKVTLGEFLIGLSTGSAQLIKSATGFQFLWFLPSLFSLIVIRMTYTWLKGWAKVVFLMFAFICHVTVGLVPKDIVTYFPLGLGPAIYVFFLGIYIEFIYKKIKVHGICVMIASFSSWIFLYYLAYRNGYSINVGIMKVPSVLDWDRLLIQDGIIIFSFIFITSVSAFFGKNKIIALLGKGSMEIYLVHSMVFYGLHYFLVDVLYPEFYDSNINFIILFLITFYFTAMFSLKMSFFINKFSIVKKILLPKNIDDFCFANILR